MEHPLKSDMLKQVFTSLSKSTCDAGICPFSKTAAAARIQLSFSYFEFKIILIGLDISIQKTKLPVFELRTTDSKRQL